MVEAAMLSEFETLIDSKLLLEAESRLLSEVELLIALDELFDREAIRLS